MKEVNKYKLDISLGLITTVFVYLANFSFEINLLLVLLYILIILCLSLNADKFILLEAFHDFNFNYYGIVITIIFSIISYLIDLDKLIYFSLLIMVFTLLFNIKNSFFILICSVSFVALFFSNLTKISEFNFGALIFICLIYYFIFEIIKNLNRTNIINTSK